MTAVAVAGGWYLTGGAGCDRRSPIVRWRSSPFETLGQEETTAFTEWVQTGILMRLSTSSGLVVKSRTSVMRYRTGEESLPEIASELGVSWVLRGEVQESGGKV